MHTDGFVACMDKNWQRYQMNSWKEHVNVGTGEVKCVYTIKYVCISFCLAPIMPLPQCLFPENVLGNVLKVHVKSE